MWKLGVVVVDLDGIECAGIVSREQQRIREKCFCAYDDASDSEGGAGVLE